MKLSPFHNTRMKLFNEGKFVRYLAYLVLVLVSGCGSRESAVESAIRTKTLHVGIGSEPQSLDPHITTGLGESLVNKSLFEGLVIEDPVTGEPSPGAASHWETSNDQRIYTFHLRPEAKWSDGKPLTAHNFVNSCQRGLSPLLGAEYANDFFYLEGAKNYQEGREADFSTVGVKALNDHTLQFTLITPIPHLLKLMLGVAWLPVRVDQIEQFGGIDERGTNWIRPGILIGNGPFVLKEWSQNEIIIVEKSPTYWDAEKVKLERIFFHPVENVNTEERMFRAGQLHITNEFPIAKIDQYRENEPDLLWSKPEGRNVYLTFNPTVDPMTDARVRRAMSLALNRENLAENVMKGTWVPAYNLVPSGLSGYTAGNQFKSDSAEARRLLAEAGYPNGEGFPEVQLIYPNRGNLSTWMVAVQEQWHSQLGINVSLLQTEWKVWLDALREGDFQLSWDGWSMRHPHKFFELFVTGNLASYCLWSDAEYDRLFGEATTTLSEDERISIYNQLEQKLASEVPMIPLAFRLRTHLIHPTVKGYVENPYNRRPWKAISLEENE